MDHSRAICLAASLIPFALGCAGSGGSSASTTTTGFHNGLGPMGPPGCGLANAAFCETFETPMPGGRGGPLDETAWSFSRWGVPSSGGYRTFARAPASSTSLLELEPILNTPTFCGKPFSNVFPPDDVAFCVGNDAAGFSSNQMNEVFDDDGSFVFTDMRVRQPFDFTGRTGTIVFDVDAKRSRNTDGHGWWLEFWISADPVPMPYHGAPTVGSYTSNAIGFQIFVTDPNCFHDDTMPPMVCNNFARVVTLQNYSILSDVFFNNDALPGTDATGFAAADTVLNRFKLLVSQNQIDIWASDYTASGQVRHIGLAANLNLAFTVGYIHFQHSQYNAPKNGASSSQTYRWDNIAFDGPVHPTPRGYDVPDQYKLVTVGNGGQAMLLGYEFYPDGVTLTPVNVKVQGVDLTNAVSASFNFDVSGAGGAPIQYRFNGNPWHTFTLPTQLGPDQQLRAFSLSAPLAELAAGDNAIDLQIDPSVKNIDAVGNMDITVEVSQ
jgi:hypothetical protein